MWNLLKIDTSLDLRLQCEEFTSIEGKNKDIKIKNESKVEDDVIITADFLSPFFF